MLALKGCWASFVGVASTHPGAGAVVRSAAQGSSRCCVRCHSTSLIVGHCVPYFDPDWQYVSEQLQVNAEITVAKTVGTSQSARHQRDSIRVIGVLQPAQQEARRRFSADHARIVQNRGVNSSSRVAHQSNTPSRKRWRTTLAFSPTSMASTHAARHAHFSASKRRVRAAVSGVVGASRVSGKRN